MTRHKKTFKSRVSVSILGFVLAVTIFPIVMIFRNEIDEEALVATIILAVILLPTIIFICAILFGMRYSISMGNLYVTMFGNIKIQDIISIKRSYNPLSSPASSLKRLRIDFRKGGKKKWILISPAKEEEFIAELLKINPKIEVNVSNKKGIWRFWDWDI